MIYSWKIVIWRLSLGGSGLRTKQFMTFFVSLMHKKDKKLFLHIDLNFDLTHFYRGKKMRIHTLLLLYNQHAASTERKWNKYVHFQQSPCFLYCHSTHNWNLQLKQLFSTMQCCSKSTDTTLHRIFSYVVFSGAFQIRLHSVWTAHEFLVM